MYRQKNVNVTEYKNMLKKQGKSWSNARKTMTEHGKFDSGFEATCYEELLLMQKAGEFTEIEKQYLVLIPIYLKDGSVSRYVRHKIDFRCTRPDGSYLLVEAKGRQFPDWLWRKRLLEDVWLPENLDHEYEVWQDNRKTRRSFK